MRRSKNKLVRGDYFVVPKLRRAEAEFRLRGDKSISHRLLFFSALCDKRETTLIENISSADDVRRTAECLENLGVEMKYGMVGKGKKLEGDFSVLVKGHGLHFDMPASCIFAGNSGTTARIISTILAFQRFPSILDGDSSLRKRPMKRITSPLRQLGLKIWGREDAGKLPLLFHGKNGNRSAEDVPQRNEGGMRFYLDVPSAQVKTALLLANLWSDLPVYVKEPGVSRDHTERILPFFSVDVLRDEDGFMWIEGVPRSPGKVRVPGDISSASFLSAVGLLASGGRVIIRDVLLNPTRLGFFDVLSDMGAKIKFEVRGKELGEEYGDILVENSSLRAVEVSGDIIPKVIDEIPILSVCALFSAGVFSVRGAKELRVKETDRIKAMVENVRALGIDIEEYEDGFSFEGIGEKAGDYLSGDYLIKTYGDHRIAMSFFVLGTLIKGNIYLDDVSCISVSYPEFFDDMKKLTL